MCRIGGAVLDILGLVWSRVKPKSGSKSKTAGWILKSFRGPFSSAENLNSAGLGPLATADEQSARHASNWAENAKQAEASGAGKDFKVFFC